MFGGSSLGGELANPEVSFCATQSVELGVGKASAEEFEGSVADRSDRRSHRGVEFALVLELIPQFVVHQGDVLFAQRNPAGVGMTRPNPVIRLELSGCLVRLTESERLPSMV